MPLSESLLVSVLGMVVVLAVLAGLALIFKAVSVLVQNAAANKSIPAAEPAPAPAAAAASVPAAAPAAEETAVLPLSEGLELRDVDERTAAMLMAIISDQTKIPLSRLRFRSIRGIVEMEGVDERTAAMLMAVISDQTKIPLDHLKFVSIRAID